MQPKQQSKPTGVEEYDGPRVDEAFRLGPSWLTIGLRLETVSYGYGTLKWIGSTDFADGTWYGVELDDPLGAVNGRIDHGLFVPKCKPGMGIFLRETGEFGVVALALGD